LVQISKKEQWKFEVFAPEYGSGPELFMLIVNEDLEHILKTVVTLSDLLREIKSKTIEKDLVSVVNRI